MKTRLAVFSLSVWLAAAACQAFDTVRTSTLGSVTGTVQSISTTAVVVRKGTGAREVTVPVNEITAIYFDDEPSSMITIRSDIQGGHYNDALEKLSRIDINTIQRNEVKQDVEFYKALCTARMALGGEGTVDEAKNMLLEFGRSHPKSYHFYQACELVGDLEVATGSFAGAEGRYALLAAAPWPDYQMRAGVAIGRAQLAQGASDLEKIKAAYQSFQKVLAMDVQGDLANAQRRAATLGKARCLAAAEKPLEAIAMVEGVLAKAEAEQVDLHARAYNTLGTAFRKAGRDMDALMAFLHVDLLYFTVPEAHAEALYNLAQLWDAQQKTERAARCRSILEQRYRNSPWNKD